VPDEYQALGYPILSIRSIPKDPQWLARFYKDDLDRKFIDTPLSVQDVWPENYSTNSVQKVWAAKFAARHPNVVVLDLSSFKCGHDAPTVTGPASDNIINSSISRLASALHDIVRQQARPGSDQDPGEGRTPTPQAGSRKSLRDAAKKAQRASSAAWRKKRRELLSVRGLTARESALRDHAKSRRELEESRRHRPTPRKTSRPAGLHRRGMIRKGHRPAPPR
jgi:hypothetical protein